MAAVTARVEDAAVMSEKASYSINKEEALKEACRECDIKSLINLANSDGGLLSDDIRATACWCSFSVERMETEAYHQGLYYSAATIKTRNQ